MFHLTQLWCATHVFKSRTASFNTIANSHVTVESLHYFSIFIVSWWFSITFRKIVVKSCTKLGTIIWWHFGFYSSKKFTHLDDFEYFIVTFLTDTEVHYSSTQNSVIMMLILRQFLIEVQLPILSEWLSYTTNNELRSLDSLLDHVSTEEHRPTKRR